MKVTEVPVHTGLADAEMLTDTGLELTVIVRVFERAGFPVVHNELDVRMQDTRSLLAGA